MTRVRKACLWGFLVIWVALFHYEALRPLYLEPWFKRGLPAVPFLFPRAGWSMFYKMENRWATLEVYGLDAKGNSEQIDPHDIFRTRFWGFDNVKRNILAKILIHPVRNEFCGYLHREFPAYDNFVLMPAFYASLTPEQAEKKYPEAGWPC